ncbi:MAG: aminopeptidase [Candidatus Paceibacterota bacterium]
MADTYHPNKKTLEKYADVLVNFALNSGKGIKKNDVVRVVVNESAKPLYIELQKAVLKAGGHIIGVYRPDDDRSFNFAKAFYDLANDKQLKYFPANYMKGMVTDVDHNIVIISEADKQALKGVDPKKMMARGQAMKKIHEWLDEKENSGKYTWTLGLYGTPAMAKEAGLSEKEYWKQITKACFLDKKDPIAEWKAVAKELETIRRKLNKLKIEQVHLQGEDVDLTVKIGADRKWAGGSGRNIPSFELFTSPDWRGTNGWIRFNQPLYRYGNLIKDVELEFKNGKVLRSKASKNLKLLQEMINTKNADKVGEFSLTDKRHSRITKFMAETLFDENVGGKYGNTHIALGKAYSNCYNGDITKMKAKDWQKVGFNDSSVHTDIVSTTDRTVTATLQDGSERVIYRNGQFQV